ncbi:MAG: hypothetical protein A2Y73_07080 [Chloroflexi bacterium RBG_13_56_8]|nr:MAG: hypothetical protein A2Y73_07080 [Chloroflexi bacterium RBG_13_56_8]
MRMYFTPDNPSIGDGVGFTVYGPAGKVATGKTTGTPGERAATFQTNVAGKYLIQVYNYIEGLTINYTIIQ